MGRHKDPLADQAPYRELAVAMTALRRRSGLTYRSMAALIDEPGCSAVTLSRADRGDRLPRLPVVVAYARACGATPAELRSVHQLWERASMNRPNPALPSSAAATALPSRRQRRPDLFLEPADLLAEMHRVRLKAGQPSLRELERRARWMGADPLPKSTVSDILAGVRLPNRRQLMIYLRCCGLPEPEIGNWSTAHDRVCQELQDQDAFR
jgi:transcriptional regulator with XRE-family HTH domain